MPDVTWWGHSTCTIDDRGVRVLTDALSCSRLGHLRRRRGPVPDDRSRCADLAVVSHLHADHLHLGSLSVLPRHIPVAVPSGALRAVPGLRRLRDRELVEVVPDWLPVVRDAVGCCDIALLPVGGWGPTLRSGHLDATTPFRCTSARCGRSAMTSLVG